MFKNIGFRHQLGIVFSFGIFLLALITTIVVSNVSASAMRARILSESVKITQTLAEQSTLALLYDSAENAADAVKMFTSFVDVIGIEILNTESSSLYLEGITLPSNSSNNSVPKKPELSKENALAWEFTAPVVLSQSFEENPSSELDHLELHYADSQILTPEVIGYVKLIISKQSLNRMTSKIFWYNLVVSISLASAIFIILLTISRRLLNPIHHLAQTMSAAQSGKKVNQVALSGPPDIQEMFKAFNTMMEILERREGELRKARDKAYELAQMKGEFAANVSHELRTPMNGVLGMLDMLTDLGLTEKQNEHVTVAKNSAKSLLSLINNILDFSKNDSGKSIIELEHFDLRENIEEIIALLGTQTQIKKIDLAYIIAEDIPRCFVGDISRIRQVLMNLIGNAIKFTSVGCVSIEISLDTNLLTNNDYINLRFNVNDTGIGIPQDKQQHIFEAFSQADSSTTRKFGGTGLGLSICKQIVELLGGNIGVHSEVGIGSQFWFNVPLQKKVQIKQSQLLKINKNELRVLLVGIHKSTRKSIHSMLSQHNTSIIEASSYDNAIEKFTHLTSAHKCIDLLIVDELLNDDNCTKLIDHIKSHQEQTLRSLVMTYNTIDPTTTAKDHNTCSYLTKPIIYGHLIKHLNHFWSDNESNNNKTDCKLTNETTFSNTRLLVVDDNRVNQLVATGLLSPFGCETETAINGVECLEKLSEKKYDLIFMDCNMPEMDGYEATQIIRQKETDNEHIIIIAITANAGEGDREKCLSSGMDDYLAKPFNREDLKRKLTHWLHYKIQDK